MDLGLTPDEVLSTTRAVRKRLDFDKPVDRSVILECLGIALQAPSGGNSQPWRWLVVDDDHVKSQLGVLYKKAHDPYMAANREAGVTTLLVGSPQPEALRVMAELAA